MKDHTFHDLKEGAQGSLFNHFINLVVTARLETGFRSNAFDLDEDVNIYLASLLQNFLSEGYRQTIAPSIHLYESDIHADGRAACTLRERFNLYRHTADYLTLRLGIFRGVVRRSAPSTGSAFRLTNEDYQGRARAYYAYASESFRQLRREKSGLSEVLEKISRNFPVYLNLLYHLREKYFGLIDRFSDGEWFHFVHKNILQRSGIESKVYVDLMDEFLLHLSSWKKGRNAHDRDMLRILAAELRRLNPEFNFDVETLVLSGAA